MIGSLALFALLNGGPLAHSPGEQVAVFAGGCFWGVEAVFEHVRGVVRVTSGYSGGHEKSPSYERVSDGTTGHAESVEIVFDPSKITYARLLEVFFSVAHDPTQLNRQGPDVGTQYRSVVFYRTAEQKRDAESIMTQLTRAETFVDPIVTSVTELQAFYPAEEYHQDFAAKHPTHPYIVIHDRPKVEELKRRFPDLYQDEKVSQDDARPLSNPRRNHS